jgi:hypothetical protein
MQVPTTVEPPPRPAGTHAALSATPAQLIQDRSSTVLPLPADADTTVTRACVASRPNSRGRDTTPRVPRPVAPPQQGPLRQRTPWSHHRTARPRGPLPAVNL